jgi:hypothetical protein
MGLYNTVEVELKLKCCGKLSNNWQSKFASIIGESGVIYPVSLCMCRMTIADLDYGEIHNWCSDCQKMTEYKIAHGTIRIKAEDLEDIGEYYDT